MRKLLFIFCILYWGCNPTTTTSNDFIETYNISGNSHKICIANNNIYLLNNEFGLIELWDNPLSLSFTYQLDGIDLYAEENLMAVVTGHELNIINFSLSNEPYFSQSIDLENAHFVDGYQDWIVVVSKNSIDLFDATYPESITSLGSYVGDEFGNSKLYYPYLYIMSDYFKMFNIEDPDNIRPVDINCYVPNLIDFSVCDEKIYFLTNNSVIVYDYTCNNYFGEFQLSQLYIYRQIGVHDDSIIINTDEDYFLLYNINQATIGISLIGEKFSGYSEDFILSHNYLYSCGSNGIRKTNLDYFSEE